MAAMHWMVAGHGYELTAIDVLEAHRHGMEAARRNNSPPAAASSTLFGRTELIYDHISLGTGLLALV
jgi:hypothetical protein